MATSNTTMAHKLQRALNDRFNARILLNRSQWFSEQQNRPVTVYHIRQAVKDEERNKTYSVELFKSTSELQIVLWLRDKWFELNGWPIPDNNESWNEIKKQQSEMKK